MEIVISGTSKRKKNIKKCEHGKIKSRCRICGGSQFCEHNKRKDNCRQCNGSSFCEHNKRKNDCKQCNSSQICEHNRFKKCCKLCHGSQICEHNIMRNRCRICGGSQICEHDKRKDRCIQCNGKSLCIHGIEKYNCIQCKGSQVCEHNKQKRYCKLCDGSALCKTAYCESYKQNIYNGYCLRCFVMLYPENNLVKNFKTKERTVSDFIKSFYQNFDWIHDKRISDGCSLRRPDLFLDLGYQIIIIEIDENQHETYDCSCENKRMMILSQDVNHRPIIFIRFNPDSYTKNDNTDVTSCWKINGHTGLCQIKKSKEKEWTSRLDTLKKQVDYWINNQTEKTLEVIHLYYDNFE